MEKRNFEEWFSKLKVSISSYDFYVDFKKVIDSVTNLKLELSILSSLIGSQNIEKDFEDIVNKYPETLRCIPTLLAVRGYEIYVFEGNKTHLYEFKGMKNSIEQYKTFMKKVGLFDMLSQNKITNLIDYVLGVEVGLDSHSRKNRRGKEMEELVEKYIIEAGLTKEKDYFKEVYLSDVAKDMNFNFENKEIFGKRFDFIIRKEDTIYAIETNFYGGIGGSKLNETTRSYKMLSLEAKKIKGFTFVWVTDGIAWKSTKNALKEAFDALDTLFNIDDLESGALTRLLK